MDRPLQDIEKVCRLCGLPFTFTVDDQQHVARNGWREPERCKPCRAHKRRYDSTYRPEAERP